MSSLALDITKVETPKSVYAKKCPGILKKVAGILVHNTYGFASAMSEISYMLSNSSFTSFHFAADETRAVHGIPLDRNTHHAGAAYPNYNMISIEICRSRSDLNTFLKAEENGAKLTAILLVQFDLKVSDVHMHREYKATECPHRTYELGWHRFLKLCREVL